MYQPNSPRGTQARDYFLEGYGCAQAVLMTFEDVTGLEATKAAKLASSFGGGMGRMREVCGAVSGALMVLGLTVGYNRPDDTDGKSRHYALVRDFAARFRARSLPEGLPNDREGSIICRELLAAAKVPNAPGGEAEARTTGYYQKRPCPDLCAIAADITVELLTEQGVWLN